MFKATLGGILENNHQKFGGIPNPAVYQELSPWKTNMITQKLKVWLQMVFSMFFLFKFDETVSASKMWVVSEEGGGTWHLTMEAFFGRQASHLPHLRRWQSLGASDQPMNLQNHAISPVISSLKKGGCFLVPFFRRPEVRGRYAF